MHGLPTEKATEKKYNYKSVDEIRENVGNFIRDCNELSTNNMKKMNEEFKNVLYIIIYGWI